MDDSTLRTLVQEVGKTELGEDDDTREHSLRQFREWVGKNPNTRDCRTDDDFLLGFLRTKKFSVNLAQQMLIKFLTSWNKLSKFTTNLDILDTVINTISSKNYIYRSPFRDEQGRYPFVLYVGALNPSEVSFVDVARLTFLNYIHLMNDPPSQVLGYIYVVDLGDVVAGHATFWPISDLLTFIDVFQKAIPIRHREIHIIRMNSVMKMLLNVARQALSKKLQGRFHIHETLEDLHKKVSPKVLPKEYGGTMPAKEMCDLWTQQMIESREMVLGMADMRVLVDDEECAVETGSFRTLTID